MHMDFEIKRFSFVNLIRYLHRLNDNLIINWTMNYWYNINHDPLAFGVFNCLHRSTTIFISVSKNNDFLPSIWR